MVEVCAGEEIKATPAIVHRGLIGNVLPHGVYIRGGTFVFVIQSFFAFSVGEEETAVVATHVCFEASE